MGGCGALAVSAGTSLSLTGVTVYKLRERGLQFCRDNFNVRPGTSCMHPLTVCCTSLHLKTVPSMVQHLTLSIFVVYGEWVNLVIVSAWHLVL